MYLLNVILHPQEYVYTTEIKGGDKKMAAIINEMPIKKHLVKIALSIMLIVALIATTFLTTDSL